ncbi:MAG: exosortase T [Candidatus Competibacteraceae bacterium]|nr:exosortase T [Candidatus Competibacteraceae bacterium]
MRYRLISLLGPTALLLGLVLLAIHPLLWLVGTWFDPAYDSYGLWMAALTFGLLLWSASSPLQTADSSRTSGWVLLLSTALARLLGQWLGINILGAAALAVDVYAVGLLLGLERRARPLSPGWLAVLFAFALPLERILQRGFGFVLQQLSAAGACAALKLGAAPVECQGIQLQWNQQIVLVDLPCSGTRGLLLLLLLYIVLAVLTRPSWGRAAVGALLALAAATLGNSLRIVALAAGLAHREALGGIDVFAEPWHGAIGLIALMLSALPLLAWARGTVPAAPSAVAGSSAFQPFAIKPLAGLAFLAACAGIIALPSRPIDVAHALPSPQLPDRIAVFPAQSGALTDKERLYFTRYGGGAARAAYGPYGLLIVATSAPLRHLHAPEECLTGVGHTVRYLGQTGSPIPSAIYQSIDPQGQVWRVAVTYVSERGEWTTHVAEAIWRWLQAPGVTWRMIERIAPWELPAGAAETFDVAVWQALDLTLLSPSATHPQPLLPVKL